MLVAERFEKIIALVRDRGSIRVTELSDICKVTEETIRRDLDKLEQSGKLLRSHGGAVALREQQPPETPYFEREITNVEEKMEIALKAIEWIEPGDRIILDASSSAWYMASVLPNIPLTVLTNSIKVAIELSAKDNIEVISTGGILTPRSLSYIGPLAERSLVNYHVNKAFVSCKGVHPVRGISESNELQASLKKKMIDLSDQVFLLADYSKFGIQAFAFVAAITDIDVLITDGKTASEDMAEFSEMKVEVVQTS